MSLIESVEKVQAGSFDEVICNEGLMAVEFWVRFCGDCMKFKPIYE